MAGLSVKVTPNARQSELVGWIDDADGGERLRIKLRAPPVEGKANRELIAFLSRQLRVPKGAFSLSRGGKSRSKTIAVDGIDEGELRLRIDKLLP